MNPTTRPFALVLLLGATLAAAQPKRPPEPPPEMYTVPMAVPPGRETALTFVNAPAGTPTALWTNVPAATAKVDPSSVTLTVPADTPAGVYALRLATTAAASKLHLVMVDDLETTPANHQNTTTTTAQKLTPPAAVEGACTSLACDYYRFPARRGQRIAFEAVARRLGSRLDPVLRILDSTGRELAAVDDTPCLSAAVRFAHTFPADGDYLLELRDADYQGGPDRRYRLRIGDFPTATVPFPLAGQRGATAPFEFAGPTGEPALAVTELKLPSDRPRANFTLKSPNAVTSAFVSILTDTTPDLVAPTTNDARERAAPISLPVNISGRFPTPGNHPRYYTFDAKKGDAITLRAQTRSLASPATVSLELLKPDGETLAESKPADADEGQLDATIPADGHYVLAVSELAAAGGPAHVYRLTARRTLPGFSLTAETDRLTAPAGGTAKLKLKCTRRDYTGPIQLSLDPAPAGLTLRNPTLPAGKTETTLEITLPPNTQPNTLLTFRLLATATIDNHPVTTPATTPDLLKSTFPKLTLAMPELEGLIALAVTPR